MQLFYVLPILIGFIVGYFFNTAVIVFMTIVAAVVGVILRPKREQEIGALIGVIAWIMIALGAIAMWGTHLYVNDADLGVPNLSEYLLRQ